MLTDLTYDGMYGGELAGFEALIHWGVDIGREHRAHVGAQNLKRQRAEEARQKARDADRADPSDALWLGLPRTLAALSLQERIMALWRMHPDWDCQEIGAAAGCTPEYATMVRRKGMDLEGDQVRVAVRLLGQGPLLDCQRRGHAERAHQAPVHVPQPRP